MSYHTRLPSVFFFFFARQNRASMQTVSMTVSRGRFPKMIRKKLFKCFEAGYFLLFPFCHCWTFWGVFLWWPNMCEASDVEIAWARRYPSRNYPPLQERKWKCCLLWHPVQIWPWLGSHIPPFEAFFLLQRLLRFHRKCFPRTVRLWPPPLITCFLLASTKDEAELCDQLAL